MPQAYGWDVIKKSPKILTGASISTVFSVPRNCQAMTVLTPTSLTGANWKLQSLVPMSPGDPEVWLDSAAVSTDTGAPYQLTFATSLNSALTLPVNVFGGGNLRISTYNDTQVADTQWHVLFSGFGN